MNSKKVLVLVMSVILINFACSKDDETTERFRLLTSHSWVSDSLLVEGQDASGPGQLLENFAGDAEFRNDGTGTFGKYEGTWYFANNETDIIISSDSLAIPISTKIQELTELSLKITTFFPNKFDPPNPFDLRLTFKAK